MAPLLRLTQQRTETAAESQYVVQVLQTNESMQQGMKSWQAYDA